MHSFDELDLVPRLQRALSDQDYQRPTPIQAKSIPAALMGRDILGCAQTGTGKTAAFALPILNHLAACKAKTVRNQPLSLVLAPTRELAVQIGDSFATYGQHLSLKTTLVYGGVGQFPQIRALKRGTHILIATPGRLLDLMNQGCIRLDRLQHFVLDEVDRMLDMGFLPDIRRVIRSLPDERQSLFFSATLPPEIRQLTKELLRDPVSVAISPKSPTVKKIEQQVYLVDNKRKFGSLKEVLSGPTVGQVVVFTNTKRKANATSEQLKRAGFSSVAIHGNKSQNARQKALIAFGKQEFQILVATDVASRGIDIQGISHVVNYDLPKEPECYVHRIGRTGRAGQEGIALSFCSSNERRELNAIERLIGRRIPATRVETPDEGSKTGHKKTSRPRPEGPGENTHSPRKRRRFSGQKNGSPNGTAFKPKRKQRPGRRERQTQRA